MSVGVPTLSPAPCTAISLPAQPAVPRAVSPSGHAHFTCGSPAARPSSSSSHPRTFLGVAAAAAAAAAAADVDAPAATDALTSTAAALAADTTLRCVLEPPPLTPPLDDADDELRLASPAFPPACCPAAVFSALPPPPSLSAALVRLRGGGSMRCGASLRHSSTGSAATAPGGVAACMSRSTRPIPTASVADSPTCHVPHPTHLRHE
jgi:hypothetical protein